MHQGYTRGSQVVAVVAREPQQKLVAWHYAFWNKLLKTVYTVSFRLIHVCHGVLCCFNQGAKHHLPKQAVGLTLQTSHYCIYPPVTHACTNVLKLDDSVPFVTAFSALQTWHRSENHLEDSVAVA